MVSKDSEKKSKKNVENILTIGFFIETNDIEVKQKIYNDEFSKSYNNLFYKDIIIGELFKSDSMYSKKNNFENIKNSFYTIEYSNSKNGKTYIPILINFDLTKYNPRTTTLAESSLSEENILKINKEYLINFLYKTNRGEVFNFSKNLFFKYLSNFNIIDNLGSNIKEIVESLQNKLLDENIRIYTMSINFNLYKSK